MFSFIRKGILPIRSGIDAAALPSHLAKGLRNFKARDIAIEGQTVMFKGGVFRSPFGMVGAIDFWSGTLRIDADARHIRYELNYRRLVFYGAALTAAFSVVILFSSAWRVFAIAPLMGALLVGTGLFAGTAWFESCMERLIASAPRAAHAGPSADIGAT